NGEHDYAGDGGTATDASLHYPTNVAVSGSNIYIADGHNDVIRRINGTTISTVAGNNLAGSEGNDGPAIEASLNHPIGVAVDAGGTLYIADTFNHQIRRVGGDGNITLIAGTGTSGFTGDGGLAI